MGKASPPDPPDYRGAAEETAASNKEATNQQMYYNRPNQVTPFGGQEWTYGTQTDPVTGKPYTTSTQTSTLAPQAEQALNSQLDVQNARSGFAADTIGRVEEGFQDPMDWDQFGDYQGIEPGTPVDPAQRTERMGIDPARARDPRVVAEQSARGPGEQTSRLASELRNQGQGYQTEREAFQGGDTNQLREQELARMREYAAPNIEQDRARQETQLANQGITQGSEAYANAMRQSGDQRARQDLGFQMAAGQEAQREQGMQSETQRQQGVEQQRDLVGQQYGTNQNAQDLQRQAFSMGETQQDLARQKYGMGEDARDLARQQFGTGEQTRDLLDQTYQAGQQQIGMGEQQRDSMGQAFDMGEQQRGGYQQAQDIQSSNYANNLRQMQLGEEQQRRSQGLNEMNALLTGQQVQQPNMPGFMGAQNAGGVDYTGAANDSYQGQLDIFNSQQASKDALMQGLFSMGGSAAMMCDARVKCNVFQIGWYPDGIKQYRFQYIWDDEEWHVGPIAQEVEAVRADLVFEINGIKGVYVGGLNYAQ